jgi:hypothetical protein
LAISGTTSQTDRGGGDGNLTKHGHVGSLPVATGCVHWPVPCDTRRSQRSEFILRLTDYKTEHGHDPKSEKFDMSVIPNDKELQQMKGNALQAALKPIHEGIRNGGHKGIHRYNR